MKPTSASVTVYRLAERSKERPRTTLQLEVAVLEQRSHAIEMPTGGPYADGFTVRLPTFGSASGWVGSQPGSHTKVAHVLSMMSPTFGTFGGLGSMLKPETMPIDGSPATCGGWAAPAEASTNEQRTAANRHRRIFMFISSRTTSRRTRPHSRLAQNSVAENPSIRLESPTFGGLGPDPRVGTRIAGVDGRA